MKPTFANPISTNNTYIEAVQCNQLSQIRFLLPDPAGFFHHRKCTVPQHGGAVAQRCAKLRVSSTLSRLKSVAARGATEVLFAFCITVDRRLFRISSRF